MRACPYCAEEIQDAAIKCRHCGSNVGGGMASWKKLVIGLGLAFIALAFLLWRSDDHQRYVAFTEERDAWHRKCDAYVGRSENSLDTASAVVAGACARELEQLLAYGKSQGWTQ